jgi:hypothetical protein
MIMVYKGNLKDMRTCKINVHEQSPIQTREKLRGAQTVGLAFVDHTVLQKWNGILWKGLASLELY